MKAAARTLAGLALLLVAHGAAASGTAPASVPASVTGAVRAGVQARGGTAAVVAAAETAEPFGDDWDWVDAAPVENAGPELSPWKAVAASALLPGLGEVYAGRRERSKLFLGIESAIWVTFGYYRIQADQRRDRQLEFAATRAGAPEDQNADYYEHIGLWLSLTEWHDIVRQDARLRFPDDPAAQAAFFEANKRYDDGQSWSWPDDETRTAYRRFRSQTERSYRNARLAAGAALFNRFASMIDALALVRSHNRRLREEQHSRLEWRIAPVPTVDGLVIGPVLSTRY